MIESAQIVNGVNKALGQTASLLSDTSIPSPWANQLNPKRAHPFAAAELLRRSRSPRSRSSDLRPSGLGLELEAVVRCHDDCLGFVLWSSKRCQTPARMLGIQSFLCPRQLPEDLFTALIITWDPFQKDPLVFQVVRHGLSRQASSRAAATAQTRAEGPPAWHFRQSSPSPWRPRLWNIAMMSLCSSSALSTVSARP